MFRLETKMPNDAKPPHERRKCDDERLSGSTKTLDFQKYVKYLKFVA